jgi:hypothetical protein
MLKVSHLVGFWAAVRATVLTGSYALASKTVSGQDTDPTAAVAFDGTDIFDPEGVHDPSSANSRFTVPAAWDGRYGRMSGQGLTSTIQLQVETRRGGSTYLGHGIVASSSSGTDAATAFGAILPLATGQYYELWTWTGSLLNDPSTWGMLEVMPPNFQGALVHKTGNQAIAANVAENIDFESEVYDTDGFHDNVTDNSKFIIPSGVSLVRLSGNVNCDSSAGQLQDLISKNGATAYGLPINDVETSINEKNNLASAPMAVTAGDFFQLAATHQASCNVLNDNATWFQIEVLPPDLQYALVRLASNFDVGTSVTTPVQWGVEVADVGGWWDISDPTKLVVPPGVSHVRLFASIDSTSATQQCVVSIFKGGTTFVGMGRTDNETTSVDRVSTKSAIIPVTPGEYFDCRVFHGGGADVNATALSWFSIEEVRVS